MGRNVNRGGYAMITRHCRAMLTLALVTCVASALVTAAAAQALKKITFVQMHPIMGIGEEVFLYAVPKHLGYFAAEGLEVEIQNSQTGMISAQVLQSNNAQVGTTAAAAIMAVREQNGDLVSFFNLKRNAGTFLVVLKDSPIQKLEDLKGKKFGISGYGSATHNAANILFQHLNLEVNKDVALVPTGPDAERLGAMMAGRIDATFFTSSASAPARKNGFNELFSVADLGVEVQGNGFATSRSYIASNRDTVKNALKGFVEAIYYVYANKKEAQKVFAKYMRTTDQEMLDDSYNGYIKWIPKKPYPTLKGIQYMLDLLAPQMPQAKNAKPEQFVDLSFLQELEKEGFFNDMAKRYPTK